MIYLRFLLYNLIKAKQDYHLLFVLARRNYIARRGQRAEVGRLIAELKKTNPNADINIFRSAYNVHVDTLIEYDSRGVRYPFLQRFAAKAPSPSQGEEPAES